VSGVPSGGPVLRVQGLEVRYGKVIAASDVSLDVNRGEVVALLGPNGAGKTSVLKSIMGLVPAARGTIEFFDGATRHRIEDKPAHLLARLGIANVPAQHVVLPRMTVAENLEVGGLFLTRDRDTVRRSVSEMFEKFPILGARRRQYAGSLSGGEQRQLAVARALMSRPRLMLLDEPSLGLAPLVLNDVFGMLRRINREDGVDMLVVEQNVKKALEIADRAYVMRIGGIDFTGTSAAVAGSEKLRDAYLGT
jgi:branched-chain amino acid transport system ATP-binding protein